MSTPSIQTLITQAQQVLNLKSSNEIRATLAAVLANANVGTPLNPNLTTQQLWDEFYEIVRQPSDDIMSIITDQMMRMVFSPPAPGGVAANHEVIFNNNGVLDGDPKFLWDDVSNNLFIDGSATIDGDLTVDTSTLKVDSTNDRVGIGTATPGETLDVKGTGNFNNTTGTYLGFQTNAAQVGYIGTANTILTGGLNTELGLLANSSLVIATGALALQRLRVESAGDVTVSTGNVVMSTSGKGIDFSATANGSGTMTSELLNDYEEGTFTPTVGGTSGNGTASYSSQTGFYTKIGRLVQFQILVGWSAGTATGNQTVLGLPFTSNSATNNVSILSVYAINIALTAGSYATASIPANSSLINLFQLPTGGGADSSVPCDAAGTLIITGTYTV